MKKSLTLVFSVLLSMLIFSCASDNGQSETSTTKELNTITQKQYNNWTGAWEKIGTSYTDTLLTKYFTMPNLDLQEFAKHKHAAARFVLGIDTTVNPIMAHLLLVGVDNKGISKIPANGYASGKIYDVTRPCPKFCDEKSMPTED